VARLEAFAVSRAPRGDDESGDAVSLDTGNGVFVVADGMSGRPYPGEASGAAVEGFCREVSAGLPADDVPGLLASGADGANRRVRELAATLPLADGAGSTLSALVVAGDRAFVAHVGDSRVYRFRGGRLRRLTRDHTMGEELVSRRHIPSSALSHHPLRNVLVRALGTAETVDADIVSVPVAAGDLFVLATDGFTSVVPDSRLRGELAVAGSEKPREIVKRLAGAVSGATDDVTVAVVRVGADG
jgi:serine/threonine protein phosphatase PrpC